VIFPKKFAQDSPFYFPTTFLTSSLFGVHHAQSASVGWYTPVDKSDISVFVLRDEADSKNVRFKLTSSYFGVGLTSSLYPNVYEDQRWVVSFRIAPQSYPLTSFVTGAATDYNIYFHGVHSEAGETYNEFSLTGAMRNGEQYDMADKRYYVGANRTNFTGAILQNSDVKLGALRVHNTFMPDETLREHSRDLFAQGPDFARSAGGFREKFEIPEVDATLLNWDFSALSASDAAGQFTVDDRSSGSVSLANRYTTHGFMKWQYSGLGNLFPVSDTGSIRNEYVSISRQNLPEQLNSLDMIQINEELDRAFTKNTRPTRYMFAIERSMYRTISEEMLKMFGSIAAFNDMIGQPVHRYRPNYKLLERARQFFFENVDNTPSLERYVDFYKWIDSSINKMLYQLMPISSDFDEDMRTVVESHILERSKHQTKYANIDERRNEMSASVSGAPKSRFPWKTGHMPVDASEQSGLYFWKNRALRKDSPIYTQDTQTDQYKDQLLLNTQEDLGKLYQFKIEATQVIKGGANPRESKNPEYVKGVIFSDDNYLEVDADEAVDPKTTTDNDELVIKTALQFKVTNVRT